MKQGCTFENIGSKRKDSSDLESRQNSFELCALDVKTLKETNTICSFVNIWKILTLQRVL